MENKELQVIYNYIVNNVKDKDIKEFITALKDYVINGSYIDYELTTNDYNNTCLEITLSHGLVSRDSINNLIYDLESTKDIM